MSKSSFKPYVGVQSAADATMLQLQRLDDAFKAGLPVELAMVDPHKVAATAVHEKKKRTPRKTAKVKPEPKVKKVEPERSPLLDKNYVHEVELWECRLMRTENPGHVCHAESHLTVNLGGV